MAANATIKHADFFRSAGMFPLSASYSESSGWDHVGMPLGREKWQRPSSLNLPYETLYSWRLETHNANPPEIKFAE
jgi:hypothetical protein